MKLLYELYPESIFIANARGFLLIHEAAHGNVFEDDESCNIVGFLLKCDPGGASRAVSTESGDSIYEGMLPSHVACSRGVSSSITLLFNDYPDAINIRDTVSRKLPVEIAIFAQQQVPSPERVR